MVLERHRSADRCQQKERQADREKNEYGLRSSDTKIQHLGVDVAVLLVTMVVRALHAAVEAMVVDVRVYAAQLRHKRSSAKRRKHAASATEYTRGGPRNEPIIWS